MSDWKEVRRLAAARHADLFGTTDELVPAAVLLDAAERATGVTRHSRPKGDALLDGGEACYHSEKKKIYYSREPAQPLAHFYVAHEYGHHWLGAVVARCDCNDLDMLTAAEPAPSVVGDADAYSPKERSEAQANVFAREFLVPREKLRRRCERGQFDAGALATELGVPVDLVLHQMTDVALLPEEHGGAEETRASDADEPDASQRTAIEAGDGPRQVRAGPGTGKTRTLVGRVVHLLRVRNVSAGSILALTYSNLSAQDLAARIRAAVGDKATAVWSGTFHAFGLELLRKNGHVLGWSGPPKLLDRTDSLMFLEQLLPQLPLNHYLDLYEPARALKDILGAIGRAKDELVTPERYAELARAMLESASDPESITKAERAVEVANVYGVYERELRAQGRVDFGDLVARPVELLRAHSDIRDAVRDQYRHILVDEYQDMNRASAHFLKELVTPGAGPWVVGDVRQAIYRFRGASPLNMSRFEQDFPGAAVTDLTVNYRSGGRIVRAFEAFGQKMAASPLAPQSGLTAHRGDANGHVLYDVAASREAEAEGIAQAIMKRQSEDVPFRHQVVLARSHTTLARLAGHLERSGVPCLYFGDFFERPEVRDLLSLLSVVSEKRGVGLLRVAQMPQYAVPPADIIKIVAWRHEQKISMLSALRRADEICALTDGARAGIRRLVADTNHWSWTISPHRFLTEYLFGSGDHVRLLLAGDTVQDKQRRLAVYQLLQFAFAFKPPEKEDPKHAFLYHVRRLGILDEEKQLRQLPAAAGDIDAVRLMTVHASKGLEFPVVHLVSLAKTIFPLGNRYDPCPPPTGMIAADDLMTAAAEEESLFFVGMSRAKTVLHLSRSETNGAVKRGPSSFLEHVAAHLPKSYDAPAGWKNAGIRPGAYPQLAAAAVTGAWTYYAIETYDECPRRYYYDHALALNARDEEGPYLQFQSALHASLAWLRSVPRAAERNAGIRSQFERDWSEHGPQGHAFEPFYRGVADKMITNALAMMDGQALPVDRTVTLPETGAVVNCRADHIEATSAGVVIRRLKTSRLAKNETEKLRYALWQSAVAKEHPEQEIVFEHVSLLTNERRQSKVETKKLAKSLTVIENVVRAVATGAFDPKESDDCPTCAYYFVCPSHGARI